MIADCGLRIGDLYRADIRADLRRKISERKTLNFNELLRARVSLVRNQIDAFT